MAWSRAQAALMLEKTTSFGMKQKDRGLRMKL